MANLSNRNTSKTSTSNNTTSSIINIAQPAFKAGDKVLCPSVGDGVYTLRQGDTRFSHCLMFDTPQGERFYRPDGKILDDDPLPELFHNTEKNRQAIRHLFGVDVPFYPNYWEKKHGFIKDDVFYCPRFHIKKNGEPLNIYGVTHAYRYAEGYQILMHLQASSDDTFELVPVSWQPILNAVLNNPLGGHTEGKEGLHE